MLAADVAVAQTLPTVPLYGDDTASYDNFGSAAAFLGERLVVGARFAPTAAGCATCGTGAVYVFDPSPAEADHWTQTARLSPPQTLEDYRLNGGRGFGTYVAACESVGPEGSVAFVVGGAPLESYGQLISIPVRDSLNLGAVYVYRQPAGGGWALDRKFVHSSQGRDSSTGGGISAVCEGGGVTILARSGYTNSTRAGHTLVWHRDATNAIWGEPQILDLGNTNRYPGDALRASLPGPNGTAPASLFTSSFPFSIGVLRRTGGPGAPFAFEATLVNPAPEQDYWFGTGVLSGDWIVAGSPYVPTPTPTPTAPGGRAFVFHYVGPAGGWVLDTTLRPAVPVRYFGASTAVWAGASGDVMVGVYGEEATSVFHRAPTGQWREAARITGFTFYTGEVRIEAVNDRTLVFSNYLDDSLRRDAGAVYTVDLTGVGVTGEPEAGLGTVAAVRVWPNPASGAFQVSARVPGGGAVRMSAYDGLGRLVAVLGEATVGEGTALVVPVAAGRLAAGVYVVRAESAGRASAAARLVVVR